MEPLSQATWVGVGLEISLWWNNKVCPNKKYDFRLILAGGPDDKIDATENVINVPVGVRTCCNVRKVAATVPDTIRFTPVAIPSPIPLRCRGSTSAATIIEHGPAPMENPAMKRHCAINASHVVSMLKLRANKPCATAMTLLEAIKSCTRPTLFLKIVGS